MHSTRPETPEAAGAAGSLLCDPITTAAMAKDVGYVLIGRLEQYIRIDTDFDTVLPSLLKTSQ